MIFLLAAALLAAQDDLDARLDRLAASLEADGASGALAALARAEHGRQAIRERIESLVAARTARMDRDPQSPYEDWLFARDDRGAFRARPERRAEFERLAADVAKAPARMALFFRRCDAFAARIAGDGEMEKRARAAWSNPEFRTAYFNLRSGELEEKAAAELFREALGPEQERADRVAGLRARAEEAAPLRASYFRQVAAVRDDAARELLASDTGALALLGRLLRQAADGSERALGGVSQTEDGARNVSFNVPLGDLAALVREIRKTLEELDPLFAKIDALRELPLRVLLAEAVHGLREAQKAVADDVFGEIVADGFEEAGDVLRVRKGRYVDDDMNESPEALESELRGVIDVFRGTRAAFDQLVELCADPAEAASFANLAATFVVQEHQAEVVEKLREAVRARAFDLFAELYLEKKGERWAVRRERAGRIDEMVRRAAEIQKEDQ